MCGIYVNISIKKPIYLSHWINDFQQLKHRGPDYSSFQVYNNNTIIGFHRLSIVNDRFSSNQPFLFENKQESIIFVCNGEIYNYKHICEKYNISVQNDCAIIPELYIHFKNNHKSCSNCAADSVDKEFVSFIKREVKGEFAFVLLEFDNFNNLQKIVTGRDEIGVRPLYYSASKESLLFTSEMKGAESYKEPLSEFPPGNVFFFQMNELNYHITSYHFSSVYDTHYQSDESMIFPMIEMKSEEELLEDVRNAVIQSVKRRLDTDKPIAFLLSGGVDSSLVAALSSKILNRPIRTFCCGMAEGTDLEFARKVSQYIDSEHTEIIFTPEEGIDAIYDVIRTVESWDTTTIRASVGQYIVSKVIGCSTNTKIVMVGEGPDEVCSSYLYNWYAPNAAELDSASKESVKNIHYYDVKRADRCISRWGMESRVPLLDPEFIKAYWTIPAEWRMPTYKNVEKWWLRKAFDKFQLLPNEVLWRKKEAFSDGVSGETSWFSIIQNWVNDKVTTEELESASIRFPYCTPVTKEAYYYRTVFCDIFGDKERLIPGYWQPKWSSNGVCKEYVDPSARTLNIY